MKNYVLFLLMMFCLGSCSDSSSETIPPINNAGEEDKVDISDWEEESLDGDIIYDFTNYDIIFEVKDKSGNDLLDETNVNNILSNDIVIEYQNKEYRRVKTKFNMPTPLALEVNYSEYYKSYILSFGEFSPEDVFNHKDDSFTIDWGDGTKDSIKFDCYIVWENKKPVEIVRNIYLNGELSSGDSYHLTLVK